MRNPNFAVNDFPEQTFVPSTRRFTEVELAIPRDLQVADLIEMYVNIEASLGHRRRMAVQFASMSPTVGRLQIPLDLAWAASTVLGKRILLLAPVIPSTSLGSGKKQSRDGAPNPMNWQRDFVKITGQEIYLGDLSTWRTGTGSVLPVIEIERHLDELSLFFDMIMIAPPPLDYDPLGTVLAGHVDGNIIVIEAEKTRQFAAIRLREILSRSGQPILGAVLNGQRNYLPRWLARLL
jgi:hypothetical protein